MKSNDTGGRAGRPIPSPTVDIGTVDYHRKAGRNVDRSHLEAQAQRTY